ncbi:MAG: hypothetical protein HRT45_17115 [Bdellovibrionales bacterium]|nr:hypothetical protein [Bdellovibrionales bacterium]
MKIPHIALALTTYFLSLPSSFGQTSDDQRRYTLEERYDDRIIVFTDGTLSDARLREYQDLATRAGKQLMIQTRGGFIGGGGGNGVLRGDDLISLDLLQFDNDFVDSPESKFHIALNKTVTPQIFEISLFDNSGHPYESISVHSNLSVSQEEFKASAPYQYAIESMSSYGLFTFGLAVMTADNINWHFTDQEPTGQSRLDRSGIDPDLSIETVAYF